MRGIVGFGLGVVALTMTGWLLGQTGGGGVAASMKDNAYEEVVLPYFAALDAECKAKDLRDLTPADLNGQIEQFQSMLTAAQNKDFLAAAKEQCKDSIAGVSCANVGFLKTAKAEGFLPKFVRYVCAKDISCTGPAACSTRDR